MCHEWNFQHFHTIMLDPKHTSLKLSTPFPARWMWNTDPVCCGHSPVPCMGGGGLYLPRDILYGIHVESME